MRMQVIVTGSRELTDQEMVWDALSDLFNGQDVDELTVVHGGARGADRFASQWVAMMKHKYRVFEDEHVADWDLYGKAAGHIRNQEMVDAGADMVLAFYKDGAGNVGTSNCVRKAKLANIPVTEYTQPHE